jgi:hypothetical protein
MKNTKRDANGHFAKKDSTETDNKNPLKIGVATIVIGQQGAGKSPMVKEMALGSGMQNLIVLDINGEYDPEQFTTFSDFKLFKNYMTKTKNSLIIFEEASAFLSSFSDIELKQMLVGVEHNRNVIFFLFHGLRYVPPYLTDLCRFHICLRTRDTLEYCEKNRPFYAPFYNDMQNATSYEPLVIDSTLL